MDEERPDIALGLWEWTSNGVLWERALVHDGHITLRYGLHFYSKLLGDAVSGRAIAWPVLGLVVSARNRNGTEIEADIHQQTRIRTIW